MLLVAQFKNFDLNRPRKKDNARTFYPAMLVASIILGNFGDTQSYEATYLEDPLSMLELTSDVCRRFNLHQHVLELCFNDFFYFI